MGDIVNIDKQRIENLLKDVKKSVKILDYELFLTCWYSDQVPIADMTHKLNNDPDFRKYYNEGKL